MINTITDQYNKQTNKQANQSKNKQTQTSTYNWMKHTYNQINKQPPQTYVPY